MTRLEELQERLSDQKKAYKKALEAEEYSGLGKISVKYTPSDKILEQIKDTEAEIRKEQMGYKPGFTTVTPTFIRHR